MKDSPLPLVSSCWDLHITITNDLSPSSYINAIVRNAHFRTNMIDRCFMSHNVKLLVQVFVTYVRPLLEYSCVTWSPYLQRDIQLVERIQKGFTKRLHGYHDSTYDKHPKIVKSWKSWKCTE